jgi:hypothetical protein
LTATRKLPQFLIVSALVLATGVIVPLLRAKRVFAPHTPLAMGNPAPRVSLRRRVGGRRVASPRQTVTPRESIAVRQNAPEATLCDAGEFPKGGGDVPLPRGRRVGIGIASDDDSGVRAASFQPAPGADSTDLPGDYVSTEPLALRARPAPRVAPGRVRSRAAVPRDAADIPAPPPRLLTC